MNKENDIFVERLNTLITNSSKSKYLIIEELGISLRTLYYYQRNQREPLLSMAAKIAKYFNVSLDYLAGLTNDPKPIN